jgi:hypothetical protein
LDKNRPLGQTLAFHPPLVDRGQYYNLLSITTQEGDYRILEEREKETLQLFVEYAATTISCWRFWKYNIESPSVEKADKHWQMVRCAQEIDKIPKARFMQAIFS